MSNPEMEIDSDDSCAEDVSDDEPQEKYTPDIQNEEDFDEAWYYFKQMSSKFIYTDVNDYHFKLWSQLMDKAKLKENWKYMVIECTVHAIKTCPLTALQKTVTWKRYVISIYDMIHKKELTLEEAAPALEEARNKFSVVVHIARSYWNIVRFHEDKLRKDFGWSEEFYLSRAIPRYKLQFEHPYIDMKSDWSAFQLQAKSLNADILKEITDEYLKISEFSVWMTNHHEELIVTYHDKHHINVEFWLYKLLDNCKNSLEADSFIMGWIRTDPKAIGLYYIYLKALNTHLKYTETQDKTSIMFKVARMALRKITYCPIKTLLPKMIESIMYMATSKLRPDQIQKLVAILLTCPENDADRWHMSCRSALNVVQYLILKNVLEKKDLKITFEKCLKQENISDLKKGHPHDIDSLVLTKKKMALDILIVYILYETKINNLSWPETVAILDEYLSDSCDPLAIYTYVEFVRSRGSTDDAKAAYEVALTRLQELEEQTYDSRFCRLQLTVNFINLLMTEGTERQLIKYSDLLVKWEFEFSTEYNERYTLHISPFDLSEQILFRPKSYESLMESPERYTTNKNCTNSPPVKQLSSLSVGSKMEVQTTPDYHEASSNSVSEPFTESKTIFLSNLSFTAKDEHIVEAFANNNLVVSKVSMETKKNGINYGYCGVTFTSKAEAQYALNFLDGIEINGRKTFVSPYKEQRLPVSKRLPKNDGTEPTVLFLTDVPKEWQNPQKLEMTFAIYGHVKSVNVDDKLEPATARIEYIFSSDAMNGFQQWKDGNLLANTGIKIRVGYSGMKRNNLDSKKKKPKQSHEASSHKESKQNFSKKMDKEGKGNKKDSLMLPMKEYQFIPSRLMKRSAVKNELESTAYDTALNKTIVKKQKLQLGTPRNVTCTVTSQTSVNPASSAEESEPQKQLSNEDFQNMFKKS